MARPAGVFSRILLFLLQAIAFAALFLVGGYWAEIRLGFEVQAMQQRMIALQHGTTPPSPMPMLPLWKLHISPTLDYVANGLIFASILLVLILLFEVLRRRLRPWALLTILAFVTAFLVSLIAHSGFVPLTNS